MRSAVKPVACSSSCCCRCTCGAPSCTCVVLQDATEAALVLLQCGHLCASILGCDVTSVHVCIVQPCLACLALWAALTYVTVSVVAWLSSTIAWMSSTIVAG